MGSQAICASRWVWMSTKPGVTVLPAASISRLPLASTLPTVVMRSASTAMSADLAAAPVPSTTVPLRMTRSWLTVVSCLAEGNKESLTLSVERSVPSDDAYHSPPNRSRPMGQLTLSQVSAYNGVQLRRCIGIPAELFDNALRVRTSPVEKPIRVA